MRDDRNAYIRKQFHNFSKEVEVVSNGCWEWQGPRTYDNVGYFGAWPAHLFMWRYLHGKPDAGKFVRRICRNPVCVCPWHLKLGSYVQLRRDRRGVRKARLLGAAAEVRRATQRSYPWDREDFENKPAAPEELSKLCEIFNVAA